MKLYSKRHNNRLQDSVVLFKSPIDWNAPRRVFYCDVQGEMEPHELKVYVDDIIKKVNEAEAKPFVSTYSPLTDTAGDEIKTDITFKTRYDENLKTHNSVFAQVMAEMAAEQKLEESLSAGTFYAPYIPDLPTQKKMEEVSFANAKGDAFNVALNKGWISQRAALNMNGFTDEKINNMVENIITGYQSLHGLMHNPK